MRLEDLPEYEFLAADRGLIKDLAAGKLLYRFRFQGSGFGCQFLVVSFQLSLSGFSFQFSVFSYEPTGQTWMPITPRPGRLRRVRGLGSDYDRRD